MRTNIVGSFQNMLEFLHGLPPETNFSQGSLSPYVPFQCPVKLLLNSRNDGHKYNVHADHAVSEDRITYEHPLWAVRFIREFDNHFSTEDTTVADTLLWLSNPEVSSVIVGKDS